MEENELITQAHQKAHEMLKRVVHEKGFKASANPGGYHQIWMRDTAISMIGLLDADEFVKPARRSLLTIGRAQGSTGWIPNNYDTAVGEPTRRGPDGYDNCSWFVIGHGLLFRKTKDLKFLRAEWPAIVKALQWLESHESSQELLYMAEAGDWMDIFSVRGHGLYVNMVYYLAAREASGLAGALKIKDMTRSWEKRAARLKDTINERLWLDIKRTIGRLIRTRRMASEWEYAYMEQLLKIGRLPFYLAFLGFKEAGTYFDTFGNLLAILTGVADKNRTDSILDYIDEVGIDKPFPSKAIHPAIAPGDPNWREYFRTLNLNLPHQYHNAGIWPFLGGFQVLALVKAGRLKKARETLARLTQANRVGRGETEWEFNEWLNGLTGRPGGKEYQTWSAALYLAAHRAVTENKLPEIFE